MMVVLVLVALAGLAAVGYVVSIAASAPPLTSLKEREPGSKSEVLAADGSRLGFIQSNELRRPPRATSSPRSSRTPRSRSRTALLPAQGRRLRGHRPRRVQEPLNQKTVQGGSTITMQLVRNLYISSERTYQRKIREAKVAEEIENEHSKEWILDKYLNTVPYGTLGGQTAVGAKAAARIYFNKRSSS